MSDCNGCFNGCTQIISDQCVKYTGEDIPSLEIENGDPLAEVQEKIIQYLQSVISGEGITPSLPETICDIINDELPQTGDISLNDIISALISGACSIKEQLDELSSDFDAIEGTYTTSCLTSVTGSSGTHAILQAVILKVCSLSTNLTTLTSLLSEYVKIDDIDQYIEDYLNESDSPVLSDKMYVKMVPYTAVEYYGEIAGNFDATGKGIAGTLWEQVYLCNGENGTPDKRGRIPVGCTTMAGQTTDPDVQPGVGLNPDFTNPEMTSGANQVTLITSNLPSHTHTSTSTVADPGHRHIFGGDDGFITHGGFLAASGLMAFDLESGGSTNARYLYTKSVDNTNVPQTTGITVSTTVSSTGSGTSFRITPPVLSCYYIMYIPD